MFSRSHSVSQSRSSTPSSLLRLVELVEQVDDGALACAAQSDEGGNLATWDAHGDVEQRLCAVGVGEVDTRKFEVAADVVWMVAAGGLDLFVGVEDAEEPLGIDEGIVHVVIDAVELADWRADVGEEHHVVHNLTDGHAGIVDEHEVGGQYNNKYGADLFEEALQTSEEVGLFTRSQLQVGHGALDIRLAVGFNLLAVERLDDRYALDDVQDALRDGLMAAEDTAASTLHRRRLDICYPEIDGDDEQCYEADEDVGGKHQYQRQDCTREEWQDFDEEVVDGVRQAHNTPVDARLQLASLVTLGREEGHSEGQHSFDYPQRQVAAYQDAHAFAVVALEEGHHCADYLLA